MFDQRNVFISYRRSDGSAIPELIGTHLRAASGAEPFLDLDSIPLLSSFREEIDRAVGRADLMIVVIGSRWLSDPVTGRRGLDGPKDFVAHELRSAYAAQVRVQPVTHPGVSMPSAADLPADLAWFAGLQSFPLQETPSLSAQVGYLVQRLAPALRPPPAAPPPPPPPRRKSARGAVIGVVATLVLLAGIGSGGYFGLRALFGWFSGSTGSGLPGGGPDGSGSTSKPSPGPTVIRGSWPSDRRLKGVSFTATKVVRTETGVTLSLKAHNYGDEKFEFRWDATISAEDDKNRQFPADQFGTLFDQRVDPGGSLTSEVSFPRVDTSSRRLTVTFLHTEHGFKDDDTRAKITGIPVPR